MPFNDKDRTIFNQYHKRFHTCHGIKHKGPLHWYLGVKYERKEEGFYATQTTHINKLINEYDLADAHPYPQTFPISINTYTNRRMHINGRKQRKTEVARVKPSMIYNMKDLRSTKRYEKVRKGIKHLVR